MERRDRAADLRERVDRLAEHFDHFLLAHDTRANATSQQLLTHRQTLDLRWRAASVAAAIEDEQFVRSLRSTLRAWRVGTRRSVLADAEEFQDALRRARHRIEAFEDSAIDTVDLDQVPQQLWSLVDELGVVDNDSKIVAGTKTLHHLLPNLVPPMDRKYTGGFFRLNAHWWQGRHQKKAFIEMFRQLACLARRVVPQQYASGTGWRTSPTKILDNALIGFQMVEREPTRISFQVPGHPPSKNEARSMLSAAHPHASRVRALLTAAAKALRAQPGFAAHGPIRLDLVVHADPSHDPWDATNYLGGVADALEDKSRRGHAVDHLGELATVHLYGNDLQIKQITYVEEQHPAASYIVTIRALPPPATPAAIPVPRTPGSYKPDSPTPAA
jgi:hypothetical protein